MSSPATPAAVDTGTRGTRGTAIGVDVGRRHVLTLAPADAGPHVEEARVVEEPRLAALGRRDGRDEYHAGAGVTSRQARLEALLADVVERAVAYARSFDTPLLVLEDLEYPECDLAACLAGDADPECWLFPRLQARLTDRAVADGVPVAVVSETYTTKQCHVCDQFARVGDETIECTTDGCPVDDVCRDRSAAVSIAKRADPDE